MEYDKGLEYQPGTKMKNVDVLSRNLVNVCIVTMSQKDWLLSAQLQDDKVQAFIMA